MDDRTLRQMVLDELEFEPSVDAAHIGVSADRGVVTLTGQVGSYAERVAAEQVAQAVRGVRAVAQEITVRRPGDKKTADSEIAERAAKIIAWDARIPEGAVRIKVQDGHVTLSGAVGWQFQKRAAEAAVRKLSGVLGIVDLIEVRPHLQAADVKDQITQALKRSAEVEADHIHVQVHGDKVTLDGQVRTWMERRVAQRAAWSAPGVRAVDDRIKVG